MYARQRTVKRTIIALLCLTLGIAGAFSVYRIVKQLTYTAGDYTFALKGDGTAQIMNYRGSASSLEIPSALKGHAVSGIGAKAFNWRFRLARVSVPDGVTHIGEGAFAGCYALTDVALPASLTSIDSQAFAQCRELTGIALPEGIDTLGDRVFDQCSQLADFTVPDSVSAIGANPFSRCKRLSDVDVSSDHPVLSAGDGILYDRNDGRLIWCSHQRASGKMIIPPQIRIIGDSAFYGCDRLTDIELHDGIRDICDHAFYDCTALSDIAIPMGVRAVGNAAFCGCQNLASVEIPDSVTGIGYLAFYNCAALTDLTLPDSIVSIGNGAFIGCRGLTIHVTEGSYAESYCRNNDLRYDYSGE